MLETLGLLVRGFFVLKKVQKKFGRYFVPSNLILYKTGKENKVG